MNKSDMDSNYKEIETFKIDSLIDLKRWIRTWRVNFQEYSAEKYFYEMEKRLNVRDESTLRAMASDVSEFRNMYKDLRMAMDWYELKFGETPKMLSKLKSDMVCHMKRVRALKGYLTSRSKRLASIGKDNTLSKNMSLYLKIQLQIANTLFSEKYLVRKINNNITTIS